MTRYMYIATSVKHGEKATVHYHAPRKSASGDIGATLHVNLIEEIDIFGTPDAVIGLLTDALAKCHAHMAGREIKEEEAA